MSKKRAGYSVVGSQGSATKMNVTTLDKVIARDRHRTHANHVVVREHKPFGHYDPLGLERLPVITRHCPIHGTCLDSAKELKDNLLCPEGHWLSDGEWVLRRS